MIRPQLLHLPNPLLGMDPTLGAVILFLLTLILVAEQISYHRKKGNLPGPSIVFPFFGNALPLVRRPTHFWRRQSDLAAASPQGVSVNYILGRFILYIHTSHLSHLIFNNVRPDAFLLLGHPFGRKLFGDHNLIYMTGAHHRDIRRRISPNFSPRAFSTYTPIQYSILLRHLRRWSSLSGDRRPLRLRLLCRDLNLEISQTVFVGPYLDHHSRERFSADYAIFNLGLMTLPIDLPGFAFREAKLAVRRLVDTLSGCAKASKVSMVRGEEPRCLIDFWVQQQLKEEEENGGGGCSDEELGTYIFDFLFAAQDASTSALVWAVALMEGETAVVEKVREEVRGVWRPESGEAMGAEEVRRLKYTETVAREVVRMRAPATMVPHVAGEEVRMGEGGWRVPKGSIVFPSIFDASFQGFSEPERFDPGRFGEERREEKRFRLNYLGFGAGSHQCVGERYAISHLVLFIAVFSAVFDWRRERTEGCDDIVYLPTISPKDDCFVHLYCRSSRPEYPLYK